MIASSARSARLVTGLVGLVFVAAMLEHQRTDGHEVGDVGNQWPALVGAGSFALLVAVEIEGEGESRG